MDTIEVGIAVFDSGVVEGVDAVQRHCSVYEKRFEKDSNDLNRIDSVLRKESYEGRCWDILNTNINPPKNAGKSDPALSRGRISNRRNEAFLLTKVRSMVHVAGNREEEVEGL